MILIWCTNSSLLKLKGAWHQHSLVHSSAQLICLSKVQFIHWFEVDVCLWYLFPQWWLECIQLILVRGPLPPLLLGNPAEICVLALEESDVTRERATDPQGWHMCPGQEQLSPYVLVPSPESHCFLDLQCLSHLSLIHLCFGLHLTVSVNSQTLNCNRAIARIKLFTHLECNDALWWDHRLLSISNLWNKVEQLHVRLWEGWYRNKCYLSYGHKETSIWGFKM